MTPEGSTAIADAPTVVAAATHANRSLEREADMAKPRKWGGPARWAPAADGRDFTATRARLLQRQEHVRNRLVVGNFREKDDSLQEQREVARLCAASRKPVRIQVTDRVPERVFRAEVAQQGATPARDDLGHHALRIGHDGVLGGCA